MWAEETHTHTHAKSNIKGVDIFGKKGDTWGKILGDDPAGDYFVLRDLVLSKFFK